MMAAIRCSLSSWSAQNLSSKAAMSSTSSLFSVRHLTPGISGIDSGTTLLADTPLHTM